MRIATSAWKLVPLAPIPPKYSAYIGRRASAADSMSSVTISGTLAATSNASGVRRAPGRWKPSASASR